MLPQSCLRSNFPTELPVIHTWQSISWHRPLPVPDVGKSASFDEPVKTKLRGNFVSVAPKAIGTFVTSETHIFWDKTKKGRVESERLCTLQSTALILGMPRDEVTPFQPSTLRSSFSPEMKTTTSQRDPDFEWIYETTSIQALLYRVASGDSNSIHVDTSASALLGSSESKPLLHGLCTLGIVMRAIFDYLSEKKIKLFVRNLEGSFTKPVWVGDALGVRIWNHDTSRSEKSSSKILLFIVYNIKTTEIVVDRGVAELHLVPSAYSAGGYGLQSKI